MRILVTGSEGLVGRHLVTRLKDSGHDVVRYDLKLGHDVRSMESLVVAMHGEPPIDGIVHLAAVSRVVTAQKEPALCAETNIGGTLNIVRATMSSPRASWLLFVSSREVYGETKEPVTEDAERKPMNVYGASKVIGEDLMALATSFGVRTAVARLSNVYGDPDDHPDRVIPAFARAAAISGALAVEDGTRLFDFVHVDDASAGLALLVEHLATSQASLPPIHFVSGRSTSLRELAELAIKSATWTTTSTIIEAEGRQYDVRGFKGVPTRAEQMLAWHANVTLEEGMRRMVEHWRPS